MLEISSSEVQPCASKCFRLSGSSGNDFSLLHFLKINCFNLGSYLMLVGKFSRLLPVKSNSSNEDNPWRSLCISVKEAHPMAENKLSGHLLGSQTRFSQLFNLNFTRPKRFSIEDDNSLRVVPLNSRYLNLSMVFKISQKISNLEQSSR
ncbi:hypothetical protein CXB51_029123 [Gossypium anomalum]|uniref:Uncharacterized protein n=1 Tax=Gossypium anomalum TaxID=47600 RepID=A0A8J6CR34_9ROSI|nr:hypothetical protein CXB51_029123 [Gossypium anomalum]